MSRDKNDDFSQVRDEMLRQITSLNEIGAAQNIQISVNNNDVPDFLAELDQFELDSRNTSIMVE